jgi:two-component system response regulator CpxR
MQQKKKMGIEIHPDNASGGLGTIHIIDVDTQSAEMLADYLHTAGYKTRYYLDMDGGITALQTESCDIVLISVRSTDQTRFEPISRIRSFTKIPILVVNTCDDKLDDIIALELSADDVLRRPITPREVLARITAITRRIAFSQEQAETRKRSAISFYGDVALNFDTYTTYRSNQNVNLTSLEFSLLYELLKNSGKVVSRQDLAKKVLNRKLSHFDRSIDVHVSSLRRKLGRHEDGEERIKSIRGVGYLYTRKAGHEST